MIITDHWLRCPSLETVDCIAHGFFGRLGGVSEGKFGSLNTGLGNDDNRSNVLKNRALIASSLGLGGDRLVSALQRHTTKALSVDTVWQPGAMPIADGLVTDRDDIVLGVVTADCAPLLFVDPNQRIIGACHAGWRGAVDGIIEATLDEMISKGADPASIQATIGPCIAQQSYEVSADFRKEVRSRHSDAMSFFNSGKDDFHFQFDLEQFCHWRLMNYGLNKVSALHQDTYSQPERFFSYRRTTHEGGGAFGLQMSAIRLLPQT